LALAPAAASAEGRMNESQIRQKIYMYLINWAVGSDFRHRDGGAATTNKYYTERANKALAVCMDWDASTPDRPMPRAYGASWGHREQKNAQDVATAKCREFQRSKSCTCTLLDENNRSVLVLPPSFVRRHVK
jgi:hypothetical protein